tara:strand:- start:692 stop:823 length:132 start_codon:yes stop_codon:yes gene_type:complete
MEGDEVKILRLLLNELQMMFEERFSQNVAILSLKKLQNYCLIG